MSTASMALRCIRQLHTVISGSLWAVAGPSLRTNVGHMAPFLTACRQCGAQQTVPTRPLATKKSKAKGKGQVEAKVNINTSLVEDIIDLEEVKKDMQAVMESLKEDFSKNLSIRSSPGALDHISVTTKDGKFPLNQLGQISVKSPQLLVINMAGFPENTAAAVKALRESRMNLNPEVDGTIIRVPVPKVTREHRENLAKLAKQLTNKGKESLRRVRSSAMVDVKKAKSTVSEDVIKLIEKQIQQMADGSMVEMDKQLTTKTKELLGSE
ncbi:ribosome-recycling factor, mitochondrial isoform X2 [Rhinatrema bivittatum]|uniref:ribosome-recycling factor, mitochondrial isoform X2 n=1 Tax=Rhinatrema bivittatum TaxID=194408 RepID=UPI00112BC346|nr:ribosome-recycling factor, mitochondrial isoform X2 [Rhinatrema bivittatum]XP_029470265.1 ribosome-recycling factor, mitochondrial isoform X2 [Rhinatrema bivittatum]XP_029470266.1 ribosome-recycling factor, mitochondrial isoform X2 [Rhinatrema bivittatum]